MIVTKKSFCSCDKLFLAECELIILSIFLWNSLYIVWSLHKFFFNSSIFSFKLFFSWLLLLFELLFELLVFSLSFEFFVPVKLIKLDKLLFIEEIFLFISIISDNLFISFWPEIIFCFIDTWPSQFFFISFTMSLNFSSLKINPVLKFVLFIFEWKLPWVWFVVLLLKVLYELFSSLFIVLFLFNIFKLLSLCNWSCFFKCIISSFKLFIIFT